MKTLLALLLSSICAFPAANVSFGWDARPIGDAVTTYRLYSLTATATNLIAVSASTSASAQLPDGVHRIAVSSVNAIGESDISLPIFVFVSGQTVVAVTNKPGAPIGLTIR